MKRLLILVPLVMAGCATPIKVDHVDRDHYLVTDHGNGYNPEKGLARTCPGRYIEGWRVVQEGGNEGETLLVTCGPRRGR